MTVELKQYFDIIIVGGGMVGASLAILLAQANKQWSIALIESQVLSSDDDAHYQPNFDARSTALSRGSIDIFQQLGLWQTLQEHTTDISRVHISDKGHLGGALIKADKPVGAVIENAWLGSVLLQQLPRYSNLTVIAPAQVESLQPQKDGYQLSVKRGDEALLLTTSLCLICDGAESRLRHAVGIEADRVDYQQQAIIANVELSQAHQGVAYERFTNSGPMALLPLGESHNARHAALVWTLPTEQAAQVIRLADADFLAQLQQLFGHRLGRLVKVGQRHSYPLQLIIAREQVRTHLALMGNAAHFLHPVAGQGFNLALRDCAILVDELLMAQNQPLGQLPMLQRYQQRQNFDQKATIGFSHAISQIFTNSSLPFAALRALGFIGLECVPPAKQALAEQTMGTFSGNARLQP